MNRIIRQECVDRCGMKVDSLIDVGLDDPVINVPAARACANCGAARDDGPTIEVRVWDGSGVRIGGRHVVLTMLPKEETAA